MLCCATAALAKKTKNAGRVIVSYSNDFEARFRVTDLAIDLEADSVNA